MELLIYILLATLLFGLFTVFYLYREKIWLWCKNNKKKAVAIITASGMLSGGVLLYLGSNVVIVPAAGNTVYSVWFKSSSYNVFYTTNTSMAFEQIIINPLYTCFNSTYFKTDSDNRTNVTIMFILTYLYTPNTDDMILSFYTNSSGVENVTFKIGGLENTENYYVEKNGSAYLDPVVSNATGYISFYYNFTSDDYFVLLDVYKGSGGAVQYPTTIRKQGLDYFVWMGSNLTASDIGALIPGFDESSEYIAIWTSSGSWNKYKGDGTGTDWGVHTFDVVQVYMSDVAGNVSFSMAENTDINYDLPRTVTLTKKASGYNYTGFTNLTVSTTMSAVNTSSLLLPRGYWLALWNETTYTWNYWISGFAGSKNQPLDKYDVVMTRIDGDKTWVI